MLRHLTLENFKAWRKVDLTFGKVTGFFGTNSAGKSSLLQFLLMLKQTRDAMDRGVVLDLGGESDLVSLGTFGDLVHRHDETEHMCWCLDWTLPRSLNLARSGEVSQIEDAGRGFKELPPNAFDRSDRKFLAVAVVANATVVNVTDSDWNESAALVSGLGVEVRQLCPQHATKQAQRERPP